MANRTIQRETVVGVFNDRNAAQRAIEDLQAAGFRSEDIGILMQDKQGAKDMAERTGTKSGQAAGIGATTGGLLGALGGLLVGLGALAIPGIGPVLAAGPLVAALGPLVGGTATGALIGAGTGAIAGALVGLGIPEDEAHIYEERFRNGGILVTVKSGVDRFDEATNILRNAGAEDIQTRGAGATSGTAYAQSGTQNTGYTQGETVGTQNTGYTQGETVGTQNTSTTQGQTMSGDRMRVPVVEESLNVQKGQREAGEVEIRKHVEQQQVNIPVEVSHEEVTVTRHAVDRPLQEGEQTLQDGEVIRVPVREETVQLQKQAHVAEEIEIGKQRVSEQRQVSDTVRREVVDVDTQGQVQAQNAGNRRTSETVDTDYTENPDRDSSYNQ